MATAFQSTAFQDGAFQIDSGDPTDLPIGATILQRHKVDRLVGLSRRRYDEYRAEWRRERELQAEQARLDRSREAARKAKIRREATAYAGERSYEIAALSAQQLLAELHQAEIERLNRESAMRADVRAAQTRLEQAQSVRRLSDSLSMRYRQALLSEQQEEEEALELFSMTDD